MAQITLIETGTNDNTIIKLWIARDKDDSLCLYSKEPKLSEEIDGVWVCGQYGMPVDVIVLPSKMFPEVTFENSPQRVEIKLIKEE